MSPTTRGSRTGSNRQTDSVPPAPPRSRSSIPEVRNDSGIDPDTRRAPSVVSGPREVVAVGPALVVETPQQHPEVGPTLNYSAWRLESISPTRLTSSSFRRLLPSAARWRTPRC
ncbi:unnamed protein product, partial [Agarophyton chilense]